MARPNPHRSLSLIRASGSTARVLNLPFIAERHGETEEFQEKPLFKTKRLNTALILKHVLRPEDRALFTAAPTVATKMVLPFASTDLALGGLSFFVGQKSFERGLRDALGSAVTPDDFASDIELLRLLDTLPSFDPFLMRERLRQSGYEPARCYFEVSEADVKRMRDFVGGEIAQLVGLALANGGDEAREVSRRLADKLMTDDTAKSLDPLRQTLRLSGDDYREGVFAWKGFLYYKWLMKELAPKLAQLQPNIVGAKVFRATPDEAATIVAVRKKIISQLIQANARVEETLGEYGVAFAGLSGGDPMAFRDFLLNAPALFVPMGEAVGVVTHIQSFWTFRFGSEAPMLEAEEALDIFRDFDAALGAIDFTREKPPPKASNVSL